MENTISPTILVVHLYEYIGRKQAIDLMEYVDEINMSHGGEGTKMYSTAGTRLKKAVSAE